MNEPSAEEFETVAEVGEIPDGEGRTYQVNGRLVAIFRIGDDYHAINDSCPHMGASLASGHLEGTAVMCPWHAWRFCVTDGTWLDNPRVKTDSYAVRLEGNEIQVCVPPRTTTDPSSTNDTDEPSH